MMKIFEPLEKFYGRKTQKNQTFAKKYREIARLLQIIFMGLKNTKTYLSKIIDKEISV